MVNTTADGCPVRDPLYPPVWPPHMVPVNATLFALTFLYLLVGYSLFLWFRKEDYILKRGLLPQFFLALATLMQATIVFLRDAVGRDTFSCDLYLWFSIMVIPVFASPMIGRLISFYFRLRLAEKQVKFKLEDQPSMTFSPTLTGGGTVTPGMMSAVANPTYEASPSGGGGGSGRIVPPRLAELQGKSSSRSSSMLNTSSRVRHAISTATIQMNPSPVIQSSTRLLRAAMGRDKSLAPLSAIEEIQISKNLSGETLAGILAVVYFFPFIIVLIVKSTTTTYYGRGCVGCGLYTEESRVLTGAAIFLAVVCVILYLVALRGKPDPLNILFEIYLSGYVVAACGIAALVVDSYNPGKIHSSGTISWGYISTFGFLFAFFVQTFVPVTHVYLQQRRAAAKKDGRRARRRDADRRPSAKEISENLDEIILNANILRAFEAHLVDEFATESLKFYLEVRAWRSSYDRTEPLQRNLKAYDIYRAFIRVGSDLEVNIAATQREMIQTALGLTPTNQPGAGNTNSVVMVDVPPTVFDAACAEIKALMERDSVPRFLRSRHYQKLALSGDIWGAAAAVRDKTDDEEAKRGKKGGMHEVDVES